jgi:heme A synthase
LAGVAETARMAETTLDSAAVGRLPRPGFASLARVVTLATLVVVLFGAVVRITGSGAGCGRHWPECNGEVAHLPKRIETWIELSHRLTSGLDLLGVIALTVLAFGFKPGHPARRATFTAMVLMVVEIGIGAGLVLLNLVGTNASHDRLVVMPLHLITTSLLLGSLLAASYFSDERRLVRATSISPLAARQLKTALVWAGGAAALTLLVSTTGAITALGDTVYPVAGNGTLEHLRSDHAMGAELLRKLRVVHPLLALLGVGGLWIAASRAREATAEVPVQWLGVVLYGGGVLALAIGVANIWLAVPGYLQVLHLLMASLLWLSVLLLTVMLWDLQPRRKEGAP